MLFAGILIIIHDEMSLNLLDYLNTFTKLVKFIQKCLNVWLSCLVSVAD